MPYIDVNANAIRPDRDANSNKDENVEVNTLNIVTVTISNGHFRLPLSLS
jgi:hypothetical protein